MKVNEYHPIMWAEMAPDIYHGPNCDQKKPFWKCHSEGDKGDHKMLEVITLGADNFPPGTKITIELPVCPECSMDRELCDCGFNWNNWDIEKFQ